PVVNGILMASTELQAERRCQGRANALTGNTETFGAELATEAICLSGMKRVIKNLDADEDIKTEDSDVLVPWTRLLLHTAMLPSPAVMTPQALSVIVAHTCKWGIGKDGQLPWKSLPEDMKRFKTITMGEAGGAGAKNVCIMGRRTWESIPERFRPLRDRINVVISSTTSSADYPQGVRISSSLQESLKSLEREPESVGEIFVIGGASLMKEAMELPQCERPSSSTNP
ncbi:hypothetical protein FOZ62_008864, partial [Perkinsus olseni]